MKSTPITQHDRTRIVQRITNVGHWKGSRFGFRVEIRRDDTLFGRKVNVRVCIARRWHSLNGACHTTEAVEWVNQTILTYGAPDRAKTKRKQRQEAMKAKNSGRKLS